MDMHLSEKPKISVCMAAYNSDVYIKESIESILNQRFTDFELIIVNDGSTDRTTEIINIFHDNRIRVLHNEKNEGLVFTRNRLVDAARADLIAILDSDDIAYPNRLELQYHYMVSHPKIALLGGHANIIDSSGGYTGQKFIQPITDHYDYFMLFGSMFINSATVFRKNIFNQVGGYRDYAPAEDFDLFMRIAEVAQVKNLDEVLVKYRIHEKNTSTIKKQLQQKNELRLIANLQNSLEMVKKDELLNLHFELFSRTYNEVHFEEYFNFLKLLKAANRKTERYPVHSFEDFLFKKWIEIFDGTNKGGITLSPLFRKGLFKWSTLTFKQVRKAFKQSLRNYF